MELERRFSDEAAGRAYLFLLRWPEGFTCPHCQGQTAWEMTGNRWLCAGCRGQVSVTVGTIFQDSKLPLTVWFRAMWQPTSQKNGVSATGLQRVLGLGSYKTAWTVLHKLRRAMVRPGRERLHGIVEVDEAHWGGEEEGVRGRQTCHKALIAIASEADGNGIGRIRLRHIPNASKATLHGFLEKSSSRAAPFRPTGCKPAASFTAMPTTGVCRAASPRMQIICCLGHTASSLCSSAGCWGLIKAQLVRTTSKITSTSSRFDSTAAPRLHGASCSIGWPNRPFRSHRPPTRLSATTSRCGWLSHVNTPIQKLVNTA